MGPEAWAPVSKYFLRPQLIGLILAALSCLVDPPRVRGRRAGSFPEQRLVIELRPELERF